MKMPRVGVEPNPGGMTDCHMADHAFLIIGVDPPGMRVDQPEQRLVLHRLVADPQHELRDGSVGRRQQLGLIELPLQIGDLGADRRHTGLMQSKHLLCFSDCRFGIGQRRLCLLHLRGRGLERLAGDEAGCGDRRGAAQIVARQPLLGRCIVALRLRRDNGVAVDGELRLGLGLFRLLFVERQLKRGRVNRREQVAFLYGLVVDDVHADDPAADIGSDVDEVGCDIGVVGIGEDVARGPIQT